MRFKTRVVVPRSVCPDLLRSVQGPNNRQVEASDEPLLRECSVGYSRLVVCRGAVQTATPLTFAVSATDPNEGDSVTYNATGLPSGASFNPSTRTFSWTPLFGQQGEHDVTFTATDQGGLSDSETITITVNLPAGNVAPVLAAVGCTTAVAGSEVTLDLDAIDGNGNTITYSATGLPSGATLSSSSGAFSWTPESGQQGQHQVTFYASDGSLSDSETIQILVSGFEREASLQASFSIYNQGRGGSLASHARAWLSDCPHTLGAGRPRCSPGVDHLLGTGRDVEIPVALVPGPGTPDPNSTPALAPGDLAAYSGTFSTDGGFGRLAHDGDPSNAAVADAAGAFTLTTTVSTSSRVGFLFERYLWVDADGARDEAHQKTEEAGQLLDELVANDAQAQLLSVLPPAFGELSLLSATFDTVAGNAGQGTPRLEVHFLCHGTLRIRLDGTDESDVNVIGDSATRYDTTGLTGTSGPLSASATYEDALALAGAFVITRIDFVADDPGGDGTRTYTLSSINVGTGGE